MQTFRRSSEIRQSDSIPSVLSIISWLSEKYFWEWLRPGWYLYLHRSGWTPSEYDAGMLTWHWFRGQLAGRFPNDRAASTQLCVFQSTAEQCHSFVSRLNSEQSCSSVSVLLSSVTSFYTEVPPTWWMHVRVCSYWSIHCSGWMKVLFLSAFPGRSLGGKIRHLSYWCRDIFQKHKPFSCEHCEWSHRVFPRPSGLALTQDHKALTHSAFELGLILYGTKSTEARYMLA